jgi:putative membrane protein
MKKAMLTGTVLLALAALPALAAAKPHKAAKRAATNAVSDQAFVMAAAQGGMAEVELGKLASEKGSRDDVKKFGQRMVDDHSKANAELKTLAQNKNITLPSEIGPKEKALRDNLLKLSGDAFDRTYMQAMVEDHTKVVREFRMESKAGKDADIKAWAAKTLPTIEEHLRLAQDVNRAIRAVGTSGRR